jgi:hypothetical protein
VRSTDSIELFPTNLTDFVVIMKLAQTELLI